MKKPKDAFSNEFDDILNELDEEDIAELASEYNYKEWEWNQWIHSILYKYLCCRIADGLPILVQS